MKLNDENKNADLPLGQQVLQMRRAMDGQSAVDADRAIDFGCDVKEMAMAMVRNKNCMVINVPVATRDEFAALFLVAMDFAVNNTLLSIMENIE